MSVHRGVIHSRPMRIGKVGSMALLVGVVTAACGGDEGVRSDNQIVSMSSKRVCVRFGFPGGSPPCYRLTVDSKIDPDVIGRGDLVSIRLDGKRVKSMELIGRGSFKRAPRRE